MELACSTSNCTMRGFARSTSVGKGCSHNRSLACDFPAMAISVEKKMVIHCSSLGYIVPKQKLVDGKCWICLEKWNRSLVKLLCGKALDYRSGKDTGTLKSKVWEEVISQRQEKANQLLQEAIQEEEAAPAADKSNKKTKPVKAKSKHALLLPLTAAINVRGQQLSVLLEGVDTQTIWMEFTESNLTWFRDEIQSNAESEPLPRRKRRKVVRGQAQREEDDECEEE